MSTVLLVGTGEVGIRAARQLVDTPSLTRLLVTSRHSKRAAELATAMGSTAEPLGDATIAIPDGVSALVVATDAPEAAQWIRAAVDAGVSVVTTIDAGLGELEAAALASGATVVTGCALAPGLSDVLARHAADAFDIVDEVHVARVGAAGSACIEAVRGARKDTPGEWREGAWGSGRAFGPELVWFPDPIGAHECQLVAAGVAATVATVPTAGHVTVRYGAAPSARRFTPRLRRDPLDDGWGAVRVEVTGLREGTRDSIVYGVVDRVAILTGVVLAVAGLQLAGLGDEPAPTVGGVRALGEVVAPIAFLTDLARRGVKAAAFEGVAPAG